MEATENGEMAPMCGPTPAPTMNRIDCFIVDCSSFEEFRKRTSALSNNKKGKLQERLTQVYLQTEPEYQTALKRVWLLSETPASVLKEIGLPREDKGIDLIALHRDGTYWAIQAKYRTHEEAALGWEHLSTFFALSSAPRRNISLVVVVHTTAGRSVTANSWGPSWSRSASTGGGKPTGR